MIDKEKLMDFIRRRMEWCEERQPNEALGETVWIYKDEWGECNEIFKQIESGDFDVKVKK
jgi:hypothetical protein